jgi:hypothetical protein
MDDAAPVPHIARLRRRWVRLQEQLQRRLHHFRLIPNRARTKPFRDAA